MKPGDKVLYLGWDGTIGSPLNVTRATVQEPDPEAPELIKLDDQEPIITDPDYYPSTYALQHEAFPDTAEGREALRAKIVKTYETCAALILKLETA